MSAQTCTRTHAYALEADEAFGVVEVGGWVLPKEGLSHAVPLAGGARVLHVGRGRMWGAQKVVMPAACAGAGA